MTDPLHERLHILVAIEAALADPARLLAIVSMASDDEDAVRRVRAEWDLDATQAEAVLDLQVRRWTTGGRAALSDELELMRTEWGSPVQAHAHVEGRRSAVLTVDGVEHAFQGRGVHAVLDGIREFAVEQVAVPRLRPVAVRITGLPEGPTRMTCTPARGASFEYPEEPIAPTAAG